MAGVTTDPAATTHVLYHGNCPDGFGGAWAAWRALGDRARYLPVQHGDPPPDLPPGARVAIVDFSYPREVILALRARVASLTILDHHKTAEEALRGIPDTVFDMDKSGAMLAWEYFHPGEPAPALIGYVQDRDLWRFALPNSREVSAALGSYPYDFAVWSGLDADALAREGRAILRFRDQTVNAIVSFARMGEVGGHVVPVANATAHWSDAGEALLQRFPDAPFAALYYDDSEGRRRWSLRSRGDFDVAEVAKRFGGGGHRAAAGFREAPRPFVPPSPPDA
jgi:uncharacterized protein